MIPVPTRLDHQALERAIGEQTALTTLLGRAPARMGDWRVADFVGSVQLDRERFGPHDLIGASAELFFEDAGAHSRTLAGAEFGRDFDIALFATFVVLAIRPLTETTQFLVLAPRTQSQGPYSGLVAAQNTDALCAELAGDARLRAGCFADLSDLLAALAGAPRPPVPPKPGFWRRLFPRRS
jgi:hypothetical protein